MNFTANNIIKLFIDAIGQDAFKDFYEHNWEARKKEIQKLLKLDYNFDILNDDNFKRFIDILNEFVDWSKDKDYINTWDKFAILDLLILICIWFSLLRKMLYQKKTLLNIQLCIQFVMLINVLYRKL